jgi:hypothetical protein
VYNDTTISYPRADNSFSIYSKTTQKKPQIQEKRPSQIKEFRPFKIEPISRQIKIRKNVAPAIIEKNFRKEPSPLGVYLRKDNIFNSPPRDNSVKKY